MLEQLISHLGPMPNKSNKRVNQDARKLAPITRALYGSGVLVDKKQENWNRYALHIYLYKFYFDWIIKINIFNSGITGAILSFYFSKGENNAQLEHVLFLPMIFGLSTIALCVFGDCSLLYSKADIGNLAHNMEFNIVVDKSALNYIMRALKLSSGLL
jgi:hypothetical protein